MNLKSLLIVFAASLVIAACQKKNETATKGNPAAEGFDLADSDPAAIELADSIMSAMGGRSNWDNTRFISWNSWDKRNLVWDKKTGRVRIASPEDNTIYLLNVNTLEGRVQVSGQELTQSDSVKKRLAEAKDIWVNDSYWLVMPFKLKDTGVTLKYLGEDTLNNGALCNILEMTVKNEGDTPQSKYHVYVDLTDNLIKQWAHFKDVDQDTADIIRPFDNYKKYGNILLSADRSDGQGPKSVKVDTDLSDKVFTDF